MSKNKGVSKKNTPSSKQITTLEAFQYHYQGPIPDPETLTRFNAVYPDAAK